MLKIYLAGWQASTEERETRLVRAGAITNRCISFANVRKIPGLPYLVPGLLAGYKVCMREKCGIMMDSGVFSYRRYKRLLTRVNNQKKLAKLPTEDGFIELYVEFCKEHQKKWDFFVTVDLDLNGADNFKRHVRLEKMGVRSTPVFHGDNDSALDYLKRYKDRGYSFICIGSSPVLRTSPKQKRHYFDAVFNEGAKLGLEFHGLGVTVPWIILDYPWATVDSSAWSQYAGYGWLIQFSEVTGRLSTLAISRKSESHGLGLNASAMARLKLDLKEEGFDLAELQTDHTARHLYNALTMQKMARAASSNYKQWRVLI